MIQLFLQNKDVIPAKLQNRQPPQPPQPPALPIIPLIVDPAILDGYLKGHHRGPTAEYMLVAWTESLQHPWNKEVINLLSSEFRRNVKACRYQLLTELPVNAGKAYITSAITAKLSTRQTALRSKKQKIKDRSHLSAAEVAHYFEQEKQESLRQARRRERKKYVSSLINSRESSIDRRLAVYQACRNRSRCIGFPMVERS